MTSFNINGRAVTVDAEDDTPLLWVIRDTIGLTGTKFGCGIGMCGACTVHVGGRPTRSCITPMASVAGAKVTTIEGLDPEGRHPVQGPLLPHDLGDRRLEMRVELPTPTVDVRPRPDVDQVAGPLRREPGIAGQSSFGELGVTARTALHAAAAPVQPRFHP